MEKCIFLLFLVQNLWKNRWIAFPCCILLLVFHQLTLPITLVSASSCVYYKWKYFMIPSTQLFNIQCSSFSAACFGSDYWAISRWYSTSDTSLFSCHGIFSWAWALVHVFTFGCVVSLASYLFISKIYIYSIWKYAGNNIKLNISSPSIISDPLKEDEMGRACCMNGGEEECL
jgi:hypothetical protein